MVSETPRKLEKPGADTSVVNVTKTRAQPYYFGSWLERTKTKNTVGTWRYENQVKANTLANTSII